MTEKIYTPKEVAQVLSISEKTVKDWLRAGKIRGVKLGRLWRVRESDISSIFTEAGNVR